ncbi:MAG: Fe-S cluster assembly protein SufB [Proteobacteria bacterium]|nr:Fe-S cluster assembly protein SufB [Pseudomonadota bacterium]
MSSVTALKKEYRHGFATDVATESFNKGLSESVIRRLSRIKKEPEFILQYRLKAYHHFLKMTPPSWADLTIQDIDFNDIIYYSSPKSNQDKPQSLDDVDPEILATFERLGVPLSERKRLAGVAVDAVFDSVSIGTTHQKELKQHGIIFCSFSEAVISHPELIEEYLGSVVPYQDNYYAALNAAVFSDGSFVYIPKGVTCPMDLSTYFRINARDTGQFERTLIIAEEGSEVSYLEGCTAPMRDENQLHAAVVELIAKKNASIKYSTVQNWYGGDENGRGGIYNFVTKRGICHGDGSHISWTQVEAGSAITWKYPSVILKGDHSRGEFYSVAFTHNHMQAESGTKMIHLGAHTTSRIVSKGISCDQSKNSYRGLVSMSPGAYKAKNYTCCDSMLVGSDSRANTYPVIESRSPSAKIEHEASVSKLGEDQIEYLLSRGLSHEEAINLMLNGFCNEVFNTLPQEFSVEAVKLLEMKLENSIG